MLDRRGTARLGIRRLIVHLVLTCLFGLFLGILARLVFLHREPGHAPIVILMGVAGVFWGVLLSRAFGLDAYGESPGLILGIAASWGLFSLYRWLILVPVTGSRPIDVGLADRPSLPLTTAGARHWEP